ncbi:MAG: TonB-dependent receptor [Pseudomonadota bacterium]
MVRFRSAASVAAICATLNAGAVAIAQDDNDAAPILLAAAKDEIIVTGEKFDRSLQDTVSSVAVFDAETIDEQNFIELYDLIRQTANVATVLDESGFAIRGQRNIGASGGEQTSDVAAVYVDGVFIPSSLFATSPINLWDVASVEIFRGPQSTVQGRNALAGAIVARTIDPTFEYTGVGQVLYADYDTFRGSAALGGPLIEDQLAFRIAGDYSRSDGFIDNPTLNTDESDEDETTTARAKLLFTPNALPGFSAVAGYSFINAAEGEGRIEDDLFPEQRVTFEDVQTDLTSESHIISLELNQELGDRWNLTAISGFIDTGFVNLRDVDRGNDPLTTGLATDFVSNDEIFSQELRFAYNGDRFQAYLGGYFFDSSNDLTTRNTTVAPTDIAFPTPDVLAGLIFMTPTPDPFQIAQADFIRSSIVSALPVFLVDFDRTSTRDIRNYAAFGEATFNATDKLSLTFGARFDTEQVDQDLFDSLQVRPIPSLGDPTLDAVTAAAASQFSNDVTVVGDNDFSAFLPKGVVTYNWTDDLATSFSVQRAYRAGGLSVNTFRAALAPVGSDQATLESLNIVNSFDPEFTMNYEFALRSQWFDKRLTVNANAFLINYSDQQVNIALSANPLDSLTDNVGESRLFGFEFEAFAEPVDGFELNVNFGFTDTEFTDGADTVSGDLTGNEFAFAPRWTAGFGARYTHSSGLFGNVLFRAQDNAFAQPDNNPTSINDAFSTVDLIFGYTAEDFRVEVFASNVLDEKYFTFNPVEPNVGAVGAVGDPRVIGGRIVAGF